MEMSEREKTLEKAARNVCYNGDDPAFWDELVAALRPYEPPKPKKYSMPPWDEFAVPGEKIKVGPWMRVATAFDVDGTAFAVDFIHENGKDQWRVTETSYWLIREILSTEAA